MKGREPPSLRDHDQGVLVVDDDEMSARVLAELLHEDAGYATAVCPNGAEALREITRRRPDAVLMDVEMHGESGLDLLRTIRTQWSALRDGANDYVIGDELAERIHRQLGIQTLEELERAAHDGRLA